MLGKDLKSNKWKLYNASVQHIQMDFGQRDCALLSLNVYIASFLRGQEPTDNYTFNKKKSGTHIGCSSAIQQYGVSSPSEGY